MNTKEYLDKVAYIDSVDFGLDRAPSKVYKSKYDNSYITHVGLEDNVKYLADREITEELTRGVGFSPKDGKWYGWSHRAICGFEIGAICKKGDCHYVADTPEELINSRADFFLDISKECADLKRAECQIMPDGKSIRILHAPMNLEVAKDLDQLVDALNGEEVELKTVDIHKDHYSILFCGRGEWTAKTLSDAKQMAIDFNEGVS